MPTITIPKVRKETDVMMYVKLTDSGVTVDWTSLSEVVAFMYSNEQDCIAGQCETAIAAGDPSTLNVRYTTMAPQFLGVNSLLIRCTYDGMQKSFDVPVLEFVDRTAEATGQVTLDDPELPVSIEVTDVDTSLLDEAIAAALDAAAAAAAAAALVPLDVLTQCQEATIACQDATAHASPIIGENGNWKYYDPETGEYVDSELPSRGIQGPQGEQGPQGIQGNTGSSVDYPFELVNNRTTDDATKALSAAEGKRLGDDLSQLDQEVAPIVAAVDELGWEPGGHKDFVFNGTSSKAILKEPIVLSQNGDSIEIEVETQITGAVSGTGGYNFSQGGPTNVTAWRGIGVTNNRTQIRADDQTWIPDSNPRAISGTFKWSWENGNIVLYRGSAGADVTYTGQKTVTIRQFGYSDHNSEVNKYWAGTIKKLKVNGQDYDLVEKAVLTDVAYTTIPAQNSFLSPAEKEQLVKKIKVVSRTVGTEEQMSVYVPQSAGYTEYLMARKVDATNKLDCWVIAYAYAVDDSLSRAAQMTTAGNWEVAVTMKGRDNFVGGVAHGYEQMDTITMFVDGRVVTSPAVECEEFRVLLSSNLIDLADGITEIAKHTVEYLFCGGELKIKQSLIWKVDDYVNTSYMAMLPAAQAVTDHYCSDKDYAPVTIPSGGMSNVVIQNTKQVNIWGASAGILMAFGIKDYPAFVTPPRFLGTNNGGTSYNKLYFYSTLPNSETQVAVGDVWKAESFYKLMYRGAIGLTLTD